MALSKYSVALIHRAIDKIFDQIKYRYLGPQEVNLGDKKIAIGYTPHLTLHGLYNAAAAEERTKPDMSVADGLARIAKGYLDAANAKAKANVVSTVEQFLKDADAKGIKTDVETVLGGKLADVWGSTSEDVKRILDTESNQAKNLGVLDGITKVNAAAGIEDPVVYFVTAKDKDVCKECMRLHTLGDDVMTPRLWYLSEISHAYHKRSDDSPSFGGLHPHCRCSIVTLMLGYGFSGGAVVYISAGHNELKQQRGEE